MTTTAAIKEQPILFSGPMVRAILDGRKTQTRRVVKPQPDYALKCAPTERWYQIDARGKSDVSDRGVLCPFGGPGDRLWVKESALADAPMNGWSGDVEWDGCGRSWCGVPAKYRSPKHVLYKASWTGQDIRWKSSIHMPRWASRITLEVVSVRVERLQDITLADCAAEGAPPTHPADNVWDSTETFSRLWDSINGKAHPWASNPWVWVVEFKPISSSA